MSGVEQGGDHNLSSDQRLVNLTQNFQDEIDTLNSRGWTDQANRLGVILNRLLPPTLRKYEPIEKIAGREPRNISREP